MTVTVKLDPVLEEQLRQRAAGSGISTSELIRAALVAYLSDTEAPRAASAFELGRDLFGRHGGDAGLASQRRRALADAWSAKHRSRGG